MIEAFASPADLVRIETTPIEARIGVRNVYEMFQSAALRAPDAPAVIWLANGLASDDPVTLTYRDLLSGITRMANLLHSLGVRDGRAVSILMPNLPETYYALWGGAAAGVANPINPLLSPAQIAEIMTAAGSHVLVVGGADKAYDTFEKAKAVRTVYSGLERIVVVGEGCDGLAGGVDFATIQGSIPGGHLVSGRVIQPDDPSVYFHTGGTTGAPKLAQQTHWNQLFSAWTCAFLLGLSPADRLLTGLPLFHANAAIVTGLGAFFAGAATVLCGQEGYRSKAMIADFWNIVSRWRASVFSGVPTIYASLLEALPSEVDISSLRFAICGAAPMPVSLFRSFEERTGVRILEGYGMTEGGVVSTANPRDGERRIGSIGIRLPYQDVRPAVLDDVGNYVRDCKPGEVGVLLLRGPNIFPGYRQEQFNANCWPLDGWFNSGDLGRSDADGYIWLAGRAKDLIIRSGHNIDPAMIEETLHRHPQVELAAAVGRPDAYAGEVPVVYVQLHSGATVTEEELLAFARTHIADRTAAPAQVVIVGAIPTTAVGKIFKPTLRLDATRRALASALADLGASVAVTTRLDERHGIVAEIDLAGRQDLLSRVEERLGRFAVAYELAGLNAKILSPRPTK